MRSNRFYETDFPAEVTAATVIFGYSATRYWSDTHTERERGTPPQDLVLFLMKLFCGQRPERMKWPISAPIEVSNSGDDQPSHS